MLLQASWSGLALTNLDIQKKWGNCISPAPLLPMIHPRKRSFFSISPSILPYVEFSLLSSCTNLKISYHSNAETICYVVGRILYWQSPWYTIPSQTPAPDQLPPARIILVSGDAGAVSQLSQKTQSAKTMLCRERNAWTSCVSSRTSSVPKLESCFKNTQKKSGQLVKSKSKPLWTLPNIS